MSTAAPILGAVLVLAVAVLLDSAPPGASRPHRRP